MVKSTDAKQQMSFVPPDFLPTKSKGILFLDEMNSAPRAVQAAAYQLILNRKIGEYELPVGWAVVAAGNRAGDRAVVNDMPSALANRLVHIDFKVDVDDLRRQVEKEAKRKSAAQKSGDAVAKAKDTTEPKKYGEGNKTVIRDNKANVSEAQLKASGMSLRAYMNTWKKTGKRPGKKA